MTLFFQSLRPTWEPVFLQDPLLTVGARSPPNLLLLRLLSRTWPAGNGTLPWVPMWARDEAGPFTELCQGSQAQKQQAIPKPSGQRTSPRPCSPLPEETEPGEARVYIFWQRAIPFSKILKFKTHLQCPLTFNSNGKRKTK